MNPEVLKNLGEEFRRGMREGRPGRGSGGVTMRRTETVDSMTALKGEEDADGDEEMVDSSG
jgi:hypothetical protein